MEARHNQTVIPITVAVCRRVSSSAIRRFRHSVAQTPLWCLLGAGRWHIVRGLRAAHDAPWYRLPNGPGKSCEYGSCDENKRLGGQLVERMGVAIPITAELQSIGIRCALQRLYGSGGDSEARHPVHNCWGQPLVRACQQQGVNPYHSLRLSLPTPPKRSELDRRSRPTTTHFSS